MHDLNASDNEYYSIFHIKKFDLKKTVLTSFFPPPEQFKGIPKLKTNIKPLKSMNI